MRLNCIVVSLLLITGIASAQGIKTLNSYVEYANQSADEVDAMFKSIVNYYPRLFTKNSWNQARYVCPVQLDEYYYNKASQSTAISPSLTSAFRSLRSAAEEIDKKCKELDTYHKLEDYKRDDYAGGAKIVNDLQPLFSKYELAQKTLSNQLKQEYSKLGVTHAYSSIGATMQKELDRERAFIAKWKFNLKEEVHTGWIVDELTASIAETDASIKKLKELKPALKYPASSMWPSFLEGLGSMLETKRRALDEYNFEAKKSDKHKNGVYLSLINYFNGVLVSDYNTFLKFSSNDGYQGLQAIKFVPLYSIEEHVVESGVSITPFADLARTRPAPAKQSVTIPRNVYTSLVNYIDYINETWRQVHHHRDVIRNLNSSASYYASLTSYQGKGGLTFRHGDFKLPTSQLQKTAAESKALPPVIAKSLNTGAEVLMNILKELDEIGAVLEEETTSKKYQQDKVAHIYQLLTRTHELFHVWDTRKEELFEDVQKVFDSYAVTEPGSSWMKSGTALRQLTSLDHDALFGARDVYRGKGSGPIATAEIESKLREVLSNEYDNMKGIEKYGRNNGLCPYTPYEDISKDSRTFAEYVAELKPAKDHADNYQHPYHSMVYLYNEIVDDFNKFCHLAKVPLLPYVKQPELFILVPPKPTQPEQPRQDETPSSPPVATQTTKVPDEPSVPPTSAKEDPRAKKKQKVAQDDVQKTEVRLVRDTVFIERRDTVWLHDPSENLRSMEGYATNNMVLLLDVSGSMNAPEKLPLLKKSVLDLISMMRDEDRISIIVFSGKPKALLTSVSFKDENKIRKAVNSLKPSGTTDGNAGIKLAYKVADENYIRGGNNRIVLATDGEFSLNHESEGTIDRFSREDIFLSVFNFGKRSMNAKNLERIASIGKGNYEFISRENVDIKLIREVKSKRKE